jgi:hypothetical protein
VDGSRDGSTALVVAKLGDAVYTAHAGDRWEFRVGRLQRFFCQLVFNSPCEWVVTSKARRSCTASFVNIRTLLCFNCTYIDHQPWAHSSNVHYLTPPLHFLPLMSK